MHIKDICRIIDMAVKNHRKNTVIMYTYEFMDMLSSYVFTAKE